MVAHSKAVIDKFCGLCQWTYEVWRTHRVLFDKPHSDKVFLTVARRALVRISEITQAYWIQQVANLHDPAIQGDKVNLGLEYMIRFGGWDSNTKGRLECIKKQLDEFYKKIYSARNKLLCHNDLESYLSESTLGIFPDKLDAKYFEALEQFADIVRKKSVGVPFQYITDVGVETDELRSRLPI